MTKIFRTISVLEGLSFLIILSVTFGILSREFIFTLGMAHGVLFVLYLVMSLVVSGKKGWSVLKWLVLFLASVVPFAFILVEVYLQKTEQGESQELEALA